MLNQWDAPVLQQKSKSLLCCTWPIDDGQGSLLWYLSQVTWAAAQEGELWELGVRTKPPCACWPLGHAPGDEAEPNPSLFPTVWYATVVLYSINPYPSKQKLGSLSILRPVFPPCSALMHWPGSAPFSSVKWNIDTPGSTVMNWREAECVSWLVLVKDCVRPEGAPLQQGITALICSYRERHLSVCTDSTKQQERR